VAVNPGGHVTDWNIASIWEAVAAAVPDRTAVIQGTRTRTWRELDERASRFAGALHALGLRPDSKVALYLFNSNEYVETQYGTMKARAVPVNVNYRYLEDELTYLLENSDAEVVVFHGSLGTQIAAVRDRVPGLKAVIQVDDGSPDVDGALRYEDLLAGTDPMEPVERSGDDYWFLYTGGTTGMPKGVMWRNADLFGVLRESVYGILGQPIPESYEEVGAAAQRIAEAGNTPVHLPASPLMHGTGVMSSMQTHYVGGTIVTLEQRHFEPDELWQTVERHAVSQMAIVGDAFAKPMVRALDDARDAGRPYDLSSLLLIISSGVMWSADVKRALQAHHPVICYDSLGSSEGVGFANDIAAPGQEIETARFKIGKSTRVFTEDGRAVAPGSGEIGMLAVGGHIPAGYYKDDEKSAATFRVFDGERYSVPGDFATVEEDGTVSLLGRGSVCINSGGEKIYPEEVEEAVKGAPGVQDCLVVGVPDERFGEAVTAVVAPEPGATIDDELVKRAGDGALARFKRPKHVVVVDEIKRGPNGKPDYRWAKETAEKHLAG